MNDQEKKIVAYSNFADQKRKEGDTKTAGEYFSAALVLLTKFGAAPAIEAALLSNFGIYLQSQGESDEAIKLQQRALKLDELEGDPANLGYSHHNLGTALANAKRYDEAIKHLEEARRIRESINDIHELIYTYEALCNAYFDSGQYDKVRLCEKQARKIAPLLKNQYSFRGIAMTMASLESKQGNLDKASHYATEAISYIEERRTGHSDLELDLYDSRYNKHYLTAIELFLEVKDYRSALTLVDRTRFRSACDMLDQLRSYGGRDDLGELVLPAIDDNELVLVEWLYPKYDWSFPLRANQTRIDAHKITTSTHEGGQVRYNLETEWFKHAQNSLRQTQCVIDYYADELDKTKRITFVPHGTQWQTPMAALINPITNKPLCDTHQLLLSPSLRYCNITDKRPRIQQKNCLVVGDPNDNLSHARHEAKEVASKLNCTPLLGADAKKDTVLKNLAENEYDVVHLACHGSYASDGLHGIVLADGYITDKEIISNGITANTVNLTACWGGFADFSIWNELDGFVRALLISGVRNVVASAYPLGDQAGMAFSEKFYSSYIDGVHPVEATRLGISNVASQFPARSWCGLYITGQR